LSKESKSPSTPIKTSFLRILDFLNRREIIPEEEGLKNQFLASELSRIIAHI